MHGIGKYKITQDNGIHYLEISRAQAGLKTHFNQVISNQVICLINLKTNQSFAMPEIIDVLLRIILAKFLIMLLLLLSNITKKRNLILIFLDQAKQI